ncbi:MAG TPA: hypothetical protein VEJ46_01910 [Candidatus Acidoferrum sp.]|nr:hypothetical protein [Candidatus Acidoferrum sp.]
MRFMRTIGYLALFMAVLSATPAKAASARQAGEGDCGSIKTSMGEAKFSGQISRSSAANSFEVTAGKESAAVDYDPSVLVCEDGRPVSTNALVAGATVVVYGTVKREGNAFRMTATKIVVAGPPQESPRASVPGDAMTGVSSTSKAGIEQKGRQVPGAISCNSLEFGVSVKDVATSRASGRSPVTGITCRMPANQTAMELTENALSGKRMGDVTLNSQNLLVATLTNAGLASVVFTAEGGAQVVDVTFDYERAEVEHVPSGMRVTF